MHMRVDAETRGRRREGTAWVREERTSEGREREQAVTTGLRSATQKAEVTYVKCDLWISQAARPTPLHMQGSLACIPHASWRVAAMYIHFPRRDVLPPCLVHGHHPCRVTPQSCMHKSSLNKCMYTLLYRPSCYQAKEEPKGDGYLRSNKLTVVFLHVTLVFIRSLGISV